MAGIALRGFAPSGAAPRIGSNVSTTIVTGGATDWHGRSYLVRRPSDDALVMVFRSGTSHTSNDAVLHIRFKDGSAAWTANDTKIGGGAVTGFPMSAPVGNVMIGEGMPYLCPNGDLLVHLWSYTGTWGVDAVANGTYQSRSTDGGDTWSAPAAIDFDGTTGDVNVFSTENYFIAPDGLTIYAAARSYVESDGVPSALYLISSATNGSTWTIVSTMVAANEGVAANGGQEVGITLMSDLRILAIIRDNDHTKAYRRIASPPYTAWGTLTDVTSSPVGIIGRPKIYGVHQLQGQANWWLDKRRLMVGFIHQVSGSSQSRRTCIWTSKNEGMTWKVFPVDKVTEDAGYGDLAWSVVMRKWVYVSYHGTLAAADTKEYILDIRGFS